MFKSAVKSFALIVGVFTLSLLVGYLALAVWNEPLNSPPDGNVETPINISGTAQTKTGPLSAAVFRDADDSNYQVDPDGITILAGPVGIGSTAVPVKSLEITGDIEATGNVYGNNIYEGGSLLSNNYISIPTGSAQGDVLIRDGSGWTRLPKGTTADVLTMNAAGTLPEWADAPTGGSSSLITDYAESDPQSTWNGDENWHDKTSLTVSTAPGDYLVQWYFELSGESNYTIYEGRCIYDGVEIGRATYELQEDGLLRDYFAFSGFKKIALVGGKTIKIQYRTDDDWDEAYIRNARIFITKL